MVKREQRTISLSDDEYKLVVKIAKRSGEGFSGYARRQLLIIAKEEDEQNAK